MTLASTSLPLPGGCRSQTVVLISGIGSSGTPWELTGSSTTSTFWPTVRPPAGSWPAFQVQADQRLRGAGERAAQGQQRAGQERAGGHGLLEDEADHGYGRVRAEVARRHDAGLDGDDPDVVRVSLVPAGRAASMTAICTVWAASAR